MRKFLQGFSLLFIVLILAGCRPCRVDKQHQIAANVEEVEVYQLAKSSVSWNGAALPVYPKGQPEITVLKIVIPPGAILHRHKHPFINAGVLLKGKLTVKTEDGKTLFLKSGEAIVEVTDTWHSGKNEGAEPAEIIVFYAGIEGAPITVYKQD